MKISRAFFSLHDFNAKLMALGGKINGPLYTDSIEVFNDPDWEIQGDVLDKSFGDGASVKVKCPICN